MGQFSGVRAPGVRLAYLFASAVALANCSSGNYAGKFDPRYGVSSSPRVVEYGEPVPKGGGRYSVGRPYTVSGQTYVPEENQNYVAEGTASWYGRDFHGRQTANGEVYDMDGLSAAHPTLPMPSYVRVTNLENRRSVIVRVNDRGPYHGNRLIDVSVGTARALGFHGDGLARVRVEYVGPAPVEGSDDRMLMATLREGSPAPAPNGVVLASAKQYVPQRVSGAPADVPVPPERPFDLGDGDQSVVAARPANRAVARRTLPEPRQVRTVRITAPQTAEAPDQNSAPQVEQAALAPRSLEDQARALQGSRLTPAVSAYAPRMDGASAGGLNARGLY